MQYEHVFSISGATAKPLAPTDMAAAGFLERQHLEEWLIEHPEVVGDDVLIVTSEYDRWQNSVGDPRKDRIDILGIDSGGNLVIIELKRDAASSDVDLQALKYAALVSRFSDDTLIDAHQRFLSKRKGTAVGVDEAQAALESHIDGPLDPEAWTQPTLVLVANSFPDTVTNTVVWLSEAGLDLRLLRYQMYATGGDPLLVVSQIYPVPDTEEFLLAPRREEVKQAKEKTRARQRQRDVVKVLAEAGLPEAGTRLHLEPAGVNEDLREQVTVWLAVDPSRGEATWTGDVSEPIHWHYTNERGKPTTFATQALEEATGVRRALAGPQWWRLEDGMNLAELAREIQGTRSGRDWSDLHDLLLRLPADRWTTYGDVAKVVGTAPQPLGQHLADCDECVNAVQVLASSGMPAPNFRWSDPDDTRTPQEVLEAQGVRFTPAGADPAQRLRESDLRSLLGSDLGQ